MEYKIKNAVGNHVIVEAVDRSTVFKTEETATIFKVLHIPINGGKDWVWNFSIAEAGFYNTSIYKNIFIICSSASVEKTMMASKEVWYVRDTDIIGVVEEC